MPGYVVLCSWLLFQAVSAKSGYVSPHPTTYAAQTSSYLPALPGQRPACAGPSDTFCTQLDYYPTEVIEYLMKRYSFDFKTLLQNESMDSNPLSPSTTQLSTGQVFVPPSSSYKPSGIPYGNDSRSHDWWTGSSGPDKVRQRVSSSYRVARQVPNEESLCPTTSSFITPRAAVNTKGNWMYVVNLDQGATTTQLVRTERCATSQCSGLCTFPAGFTSSCSQQFVQKRLVALSGNGESLYTDTFWFPHCCICQIRPA